MHKLLPVYMKKSELEIIAESINANIQVVNKYLENPALFDDEYCDCSFAEFAIFSVVQSALTRHIMYELNHCYVPCVVYSDLYRAWEDSEHEWSYNQSLDIASFGDNLGFYNCTRAFLFAIPINAHTGETLKWSDFYDNQDDIDKHIANELEHMGALCNLVWQSVSRQTDSER